MDITQAHIVQLNGNKLFSRITADDTASILACAGAYIKSYEKDTVIIEEGARVSDIGVMLSGRAIASKSDAMGKRMIMATHSAGATFGDALSACGNRVSPVTVTAEEAAAVVFIPFQKAAFPCGKACPGHKQLLLNLFDTISDKFFGLQNKINCITRPTLREKILFYLNSAKGLTGGYFTIPFDRAGLADYINADRSALSRELSLMKKDGLIDYYKDSFKLL